MGDAGGTTSAELQVVLASASGAWHLHQEVTLVAHRLLQGTAEARGGEGTEAAMGFWGERGRGEAWEVGRGLAVGAEGLAAGTGPGATAEPSGGCGQMQEEGGRKA